MFTSSYSSVDICSMRVLNAGNAGRQLFAIADSHVVL